MQLCENKRIFGALIAILCCMVFVDCGGTGNAQRSAGGVQLSQISITPVNPAVPNGTSVQLIATGTYSDGSRQVLTGSVTWQSSDAEIATVTNQGNVTGMSVGVAQVNATYEGVSGSTSVNVSAAALVGVTVSPTSSNVPIGESEQLTATGKFSDGTTQDITQSVTWNSSAPGIVTASSTGVAIALASGSATISATSGSVTGSASVTVGPAALVGITVSPNPSTLPVGEFEQLTAMGNFSDGTTANLTQSVSWGSSTPAIASASSGGFVSAKAVGGATITASSGSVAGSATVTVTTAVVVSLNVSPATLALVLGGNAQLQAIANWSDGSSQNVTNAATWSSNPSSNAAVSSSGLVTAEQVGLATIVAAYNGIAGSADLSVGPLVLVNYYDRAAAQASGIDGSVNLTNPGLTGGSLCAMFYVFDQNQELTECCGCSVSDSGLRSLSLLNDLTANPLTGKTSNAGLIMFVPSSLSQGSQCDASSLSPTGILLGWGSNVQAAGAGSFQVSETEFEAAPFSSAQATTLANECGFMEQSGGGQGICSCGTGN